MAAVMNQATTASGDNMPSWTNGSSSARDWNNQPSMSQMAGFMSQVPPSSGPSRPTRESSSIATSFNAYNSSHIPNLLMSTAASGTVGSWGLDPLNTTSYEQSRRQVSSVVVSEELLEQVPESKIKYVEVPVVHEVVRQVPVPSVVEVKRMVPKYEVEWVERIVEVPEVRYVDREIEKPTIQEVVRHVKGPKQYIDVPREVVRTVPKIEYVEVEKFVETPGEIIDIERPQIVERRVEVPRYNDKRTMVVVAQTVNPVITESQEVKEVDVYEYEPEIIPVDVVVPKPVSTQLTPIGAVSEVHREVSVPAAQFNTILRSLNSHLSAEEQGRLPYIHDMGGIPFLHPSEMVGIAQPLDMSRNVTLLEGMSQTGRKQSAVYNVGKSMASNSPGALTTQWPAHESQSYQVISSQQTMDRGSFSRTTTAPGTTMYDGSPQDYQDGTSVHRRELSVNDLETVTSVPRTATNSKSPGSKSRGSMSGRVRKASGQQKKRSGCGC